MACFVLPFMVVWAWTFFSQMRFMYVIAPAVLSKWTREHGFRIERLSVQVLPLDPYVWAAGPFRIVYRVTELVAGSPGYRTYAAALD